MFQIAYSSFNLLLMRLVLLSAGLFAASVANALTVSYDWGMVYTSSQKTTTAYDAVLAGDGNWYTVLGSDTASDLKWGDTALDLPADEGTATASKALISKMDKNGGILWSITSVYGAFGLDNGKTAAMPDGGAVTAFTVRKNSNTASTEPLAKLVDAKGNTVNIEIADYPEAWAYVPMIMKYSADGVIEWLRQIRCDYSEVNGKVPVQPTYVRSLTTDPEGNIYIGGLFQTALSFQTSATAWSEALTPINIPSDWAATGTAVGDMFIARLDKDGFFLNAFTVDSDQSYATRDQISRLSYSDGSLYWLGQVVGKTDGSTYTIGDFTVTPSVTDAPKALETTIAGSMTPDLGINWATTIETLPNSSGSAVIQNNSLSAGSSSIYISGALNGGMKLGSSAIESQETKLKGYIVSIDKSNGSVIGGAIYGSGISGYYGAFENGTDGHVLAYGYLFGSKAYIIDYSADFSSASETILIDGGQPMTFGCALNPADNRFLSVTRGKGTGTALGGAEIVCPAQFSGVIASFTLDGFTSGIETAATAGDAGQTVRIYGSAGCAVFSAAEAQTIKIYSATGALVRTADIAEGSTNVELPAGFYIAAGQKFIVR